MSNQEENNIKKSRKAEEDAEKPKKIMRPDPTLTTRLLAARQIGGARVHQISQADKSDILAKHTLRINQVKAKKNCCNGIECIGVPKKNKVTLCPMGTRQITQVELSKCNRYLYYGTADNRLYMVDLKKLKNQKAEIEVPSEIENEVLEEFKILATYAENPIVLDLTKTFGPKGWDKRKNKLGQMGIHVIEQSPNGLKLLTSGHHSATIEILEMDQTRHKGDPEEFEFEGLEYDPREVWTREGVLKESGKNYREGKITGGLWLGEEAIGVVGSKGRLTVCRLQNESGKILIPTRKEIWFPEHDLPLSNGHRFPRSQQLSRLVGINRMSTRDEVIITSDCGEIYILKENTIEGVASRGARRIGIPREDFCYTDQYKNVILLSQATDEKSNTAVIGSLLGLSTLDSRMPEPLNHIKMFDFQHPLEARLEEDMMGLPLKLAIEDQIVTVGLWGGYVTHCDLRAKKWILEETSAHLQEYFRKVSWPMGLSGHPEVKTVDQYLPNLYPLTSMKQRGGTLAAGGGPINDNMSEANYFEGVVTLWD